MTVKDDRAKYLVTCFHNWNNINYMDTDSIYCLQENELEIINIGSNEIFYFNIPFKDEYGGEDEDEDISQDSDYISSGGREYVERFIMKENKLIFYVKENKENYGIELKQQDIDDNEMDPTEFYEKYKTNNKKIFQIVEATWFFKNKKFKIMKK